MAAFGIMMCPVYETALVVPDVLAEKLDGIPDLKGLHPRCDIYIMHQQQRLPGSELNKKPLVPVAVIIIAEQAKYRAFSADRHIALPLLEQLLQFIIACISFHSLRCNPLSRFGW